MKPFPIEELVDRCGSRFTVVVAAAKRAKQIKEGAPPLVNLPTRNPLTIALHEIAAGLIEITEEPVIEDVAVAAAEEAIAELAAPELVEALIGKATVGPELAEEPEDDYDADLDEDVAADLDESLEDEVEEDEEEDEDLEDLELDEDDEEWEEEEAEEAEE
ncbi:MAG: DNA-directed RNA polymerase subunit omega [Armatimonadota bacterium]